MHKDSFRDKYLSLLNIPAALFINQYDHDDRGIKIQSSYLKSKVANVNQILDYH